MKKTRIKGMAGFIIEALLAGFAIGAAQLLSLRIGLLGFKVLPALFFGVGLWLVFNNKLRLVTGKVAVCSEINDYLLLIPTFILNCFGTLPFLVIAQEFSTEALMLRAASPWYEIILKGILCGICISIAVGSHARGPLYIFIPVMTFILIGGEHCIADCAYMCITGCLNWQVIRLIILAFVGNMIGGAIDGVWRRHENSRPV